MWREFELHSGGPIRAHVPDREMRRDAATAVPRALHPGGGISLRKRNDVNRQ